MRWITTAAALMEMVNILGMSPRCLCPQLFSFALSGRLARRHRGREGKGRSTFFDV